MKSNWIQINFQLVHVAYVCGTIESLSLYISFNLIQSKWNDLKLYYFFRFLKKKIVIMKIMFLLNEMTLNAVAIWSLLRWLFYNKSSTEKNGLKVKGKLILEHFV